MAFIATAHPGAVPEPGWKETTMHWLLMYELADDYLERRPAHRSAHLALAWAAVERGELLLAGAVADPVDSALLLFQGETSAAAEAFARADPYVTAGLIRSWRVRPWQTVVGEGAANPVR
jgi:uncharacterized protein